MWKGPDRELWFQKSWWWTILFSKRPDVKVCCIVREVIDNAKKVAGCKIRNEPNQNPKARGHKKGLRGDQMILKTTSNCLLYKPCSACPQWRQTCSWKPSSMRGHLKAPWLQPQLLRTSSTKDGDKKSTLHGSVVKNKKQLKNKKSSRTEALF